MYQILPWMFILFISLLGCDEDTKPSLPSISRTLLDFSVTHECNDRIDNDYDGNIDRDDPQCKTAEDTSEGPVVNPYTITECNDEIDNDQDELIDLNDPDCTSSRDTQEGVFVRPACSNELDDDQDGLIDLNDPGCENSNDNDEIHMTVPSACDNGIDDDQDGYIDFPFDPGCASVTDMDESDNVMATQYAQCENGLDDDQDGYADLADPDCINETDPRERAQDNEPLRKCSNYIDDDGDELVDFPSDPGCRSAGDDSEFDAIDLPICMNQLDDDQDGYIDFPEDPGCISIGDQSELDPIVTPACLDGIDNDQDGLIDYPQDVGCTHAADVYETIWCGGSSQSIEMNTMTNLYTGTSQQGRFQHEGSCGGRGAPELVFAFHIDQPLKELKFITQDIMGEEGWETTLYVRTQCEHAHSELGCHREEIDQNSSNELSINDPPIGPLYLMVDGASGRGGSFQLHVIETPIEACQNQLDDDADGLIDYPFDPGCNDLQDLDETDPTPAPACSNGLDDDSDLLTDFPNDFGCLAASDTNEVDVCGQGVLVKPIGELPIYLQGNTREGNSSQHQGSCGESQGIEQVFVYENPSHAQLDIYLNINQELMDTVNLYARTGNCEDQSQELTCLEVVLPTMNGVAPLPDMPNENGMEDHNSLVIRGLEDENLSGLENGAHLILDDVPVGPVYIFLDHIVDGFPFMMAIERTQLPPMCDDERDNDQDGFIDYDDVGCESAQDESEDNPNVEVACFDGFDNDADGWTDYPLDPDCKFKGALSEEGDGETQNVACQNQIDDDGNDLIDFPFDPGCYSRADESEFTDDQDAACWNLFDDDGDGLIDFPFDPGCHARGDTSEQDDPRIPQCNDGIDNDNNGHIDYPFDPSCYARGDQQERFIATENLTICNDGVDNDQDGDIDFPADVGCNARGDMNEEDPVLLPDCGNGSDDDNNGRIDWPDDPGCDFAADPNEEGFSFPAPRCNDGMDNDRDGLIDLWDYGCQNRLDNDESNDEVMENVACMDDIDNDADSYIDFPNDPGCQAMGDRCEQGGFAACLLEEEELCVDLLTDTNHCGACDHTCLPDAVCVRGACSDELVLKTEIMRCGYAGRDLNDFFIGPLQDHAFTVRNTCIPSEDTQALFILTGGRNTFITHYERIKSYVEQGGQVITAKGVSDLVFQYLFNEPTQGMRNTEGSCHDNVMPVVQWNPQDPLWQNLEFTRTDLDQSGCGYPMHDFNGMIRLGGWNRQDISLGYRDLGYGRVWLVESDWYDISDTMSEASKLLMAHMVSGGGALPQGSYLPDCMDGIDNDGDAQIDLMDSDCMSLRDEDEFPRLSNEQELIVPECADGIDNDGDSYIDFPLDHGCLARGGIREDIVNAENSQCNDNLDNNANGLIDWPMDPACQGRGDLYERTPLSQPSCANGEDDDGDGLIDYPYDRDCLSASDDNESELPLFDDTVARMSSTISSEGLEWYSRMKRDTTACSNSIDDDQDGFIDFPFDTHCTSATDQSESQSTLILEFIECADGIDNDQNGRIDFPADPGCLSKSDLYERPHGVRACSDGIDNDLDLLIDWPMDPSCHFAAYLHESDDHYPLATCRDGIDNDADGVLDLADSDCSQSQDQEDGTQEDGEQQNIVPECADGIDNDGDTYIDWPHDLGCLAAGGIQEDQGCDTHRLQTVNTLNIIDLVSNEWWQDDTSTTDFAEGILHASCAGRLSPEKMYRYSLSQTATLDIQVESEAGLDFTPSISVHRQCAENNSEVACTQGSQLYIQDAPAGDYYITVDGPQAYTWESYNRRLTLPPDPANYVATQDMGTLCWLDGGGDTFDCMGNLALLYKEERYDLPVNIGIHQLIINERTKIYYESRWAGPGIWHLRFWSQAKDLEDNGFTLEMTGNLGSDHRTVPLFESFEMAGYEIPYLYTRNHIQTPTKASVFMLMLPRDYTEITRLDYQIQNDLVTLTATDVHAPFSFYVVASYVHRDQIAQSISYDIDLYDQALLPKDRQGSFQIRVRELTP